jgi:diadenosine tetraphosphate (Ap4A) HIT family hydrolase
VSSVIALITSLKLAATVRQEHRGTAAEGALALAEIRALLFEETATVAAVLAAHAPDHKINIGALGNIVRQLHVHVVARRPGDAAWPGPVWGHGDAQPYTPLEATDRIASLRIGLN